MNILGISRSPRFSPNSVARDRAIFTSVAGELRRLGHDVHTVSEDDFQSTGDADAIYNMGRGTAFLKALSAGLRVPAVNPPGALLRATRTALTQRFAAEGIPIPESLTFRVADTSAEALSPFAGACPDGLWIKRGDACAQSAGDVRYLRDGADLDDALRDFARRDITEAIVCAHLRGDLVKFYGVEGTDFFYLYYPTEGKNFSKFGLEAINGAPTGFAFRSEELKACADKAARLSGFIVYGGDAVVLPDGSFRLIDFNDWPSFSRCCAEAARAIAARIDHLNDMRRRLALQSVSSYL